MAEKKSAPIRILVADDHALFREGLVRLLESEADLRVVGQAADGQEAVELTRRLKPDILLLDLAMPRLPGLEALRELAGTETPTRIVLLTAAIERHQIVQALQLGARGLVLKEAATQLLFRSIRTVMAGEYWVGRESMTDLVECLRELVPAAETARTRPYKLTPRELEIVTALVAGATNKDLARQLSISEETVKHHLTNIFDKLGVSNRLELALFAVNNRLVQDL